MPRRFGMSFPGAVVVVGVATLALVAGSLTVCRQERAVVIDRLTAVNPTAYPLEVELSRVRSGRAVLLGTVRPRTEAVFRDVPDQGDLWIFVVLHAGREVGARALRHEQLAERGWRVRIPMTVEEHLRAVDAAP